MFLSPYFKITIYFNNSNIYPKEEYEHRLHELQRYLASFKDDFGYDISLIVAPYDNKNYMLDLYPYRDEKEGYHRCQICYKKRMSEAYDYAEDNHYDYFTTVMSISAQKNSQILNQIGFELSKNHPHCAYFYSDFKKNKGIDVSRLLVNKYNLYRQNYCGCVYSLENSKKEKL